MKKKIASLPMLLLLAAAVLAVPARACAQAATNASANHAKPAKERAASTSASVPFRGTVTVMDTNAMTLTVVKRTFNITSETKITKDGKPAVLAEGAAGDSVSGAYKQGADGKLNATTIRFTSKPEDKKKSGPAKRS